MRFNRLQVLVFGIVATVIAVNDAYPTTTTTPTTTTINWQPWTDQAFAQAKRENRFVILDLEAVWCHWCHVMDDTTYADPVVRKLIGEKYVAIRVDQDSRPDISNRYEDYGWPATVVFDSAGHEIVKRRGYLTPEQMAAMLKAIIADPTPGPSVQPEIAPKPAADSSLTPPQRAELIQRLKDDYDHKVGGWFGSQKYLHPTVLEYCLIYGDNDLLTDAKEALKDNLKLIDPVWGGVDQYSAEGDWDHPHFEKIMSTQADDLRVYSQAYLVTGDGEDLQAAERINSYLKLFLTSPEGAFYVSQDADLHPGEHSADYFALDDAARRKLGVPGVDQHCYARENGWAIRSLCTLYGASGDASVLHQAIVAANWVIKNRALRAGGFAHGEQDVAGPYLGDTLAMSGAFLSLYEATADRAWLARAQESMRFIDRTFAGSTPAATLALATAASDARPEVDENVEAARLANLLFAFTGVAEDQQLANRIMRYLASPDIWKDRRWAVGGILLADREIRSVPWHVTVDGAKTDPTCAELFAAARRVPTRFKRIEWYDPAEGKLPNMDVAYPSLPYPAAFVCTANSCSSPIKTAPALSQRLKARSQSPEPVN